MERDEATGRERMSFGPGPLSEGHIREYQTQLVLMPDGDDTPLYDALVAAIANIVPDKAHQYIISTQPGVKNIYISYQYKLKPGEEHPQSRPNLYSVDDPGPRPDLDKMEKSKIDTSRIPASVAKMMDESGFEAASEEELELQKAYQEGRIGQSSPTSPPKRKYGL
jgi:hypothetical protein